MNKDLEEILKILKVLMDTPSVSNQKDISKKLLNDISKMMPKDLIIKEYDFDGYGSLVIANALDDFDIAFCTHIDVVPCEEYKYVSKGDRVYGRGAIDMKGAVAACLHLFKNLDTDKKVALFITSDEEIAGNCAKCLVDKYPNIKLAIIPDGGKDFELIAEEKGLLQLELSIKTKSSHASQPYNGVNAITSLYDCYLKLLERYPLPLNAADYKTSINLSKLIGGDALNQVPDYAKMYLDIRHVVGDLKENIINFIKSINPNIEIKIVGSGIAFTTDINNHNIKEYLAACEKELGFKPKITKTESTSDAIYFSAKNIPTVLMNPVGDYAHHPGEFVEKDSLLKLYNIYKKILKEGVIK